MDEYRRRAERFKVCESANTANAVAASIMNLPTSVAGSRFLFTDAANHAPVVAS